MGRDSELIRLEAYVGRLLEEFSHLRAEKQRLEQELREQQAENVRLQEAVDSVDGERIDVCARVNALIERLENWEAELEGEFPVDDKAPAQESGREQRGRGDDGITLQKRLFNA